MERQTRVQHNWIWNAIWNEVK